MIHIMFGQSEAAALKYGLGKSKGLSDTVISFGEILSIGPIQRLQESEGLLARFKWMKRIIPNAFDEYENYIKTATLAVDQIRKIQGDEPIILWTSGNASEQTGLRFVLFLLKSKRNQIRVINTTKMFGELFNSPKVTFVIKSSGEIVTEKLTTMLEVGENSEPLTKEQRVKLENEWIDLADKSSTLRIWENDLIRSVSEDHYDPYIIDTAKKLHAQQTPKDYMKAAALIGDVLGNLEQYVGDGFLEYRLKKLIENSVFDVNGSMEAMRYYSIRIKKDSPGIRSCQ